MLVSIHEKTEPTPHPYFSQPEPDRQYYQTFGHNDAALISAIYDEANARLHDTTEPDYNGDLYFIRVLATEREFDSILVAAHHAVDMQRRRALVGGGA